jgi:hypothetical protein
MLAVPPKVLGAANDMWQRYRLPYRPPPMNGGFGDVQLGH